jgi:tetratricopeptide (TPR) repeat protein
VIRPAVPAGRYKRQKGRGKNDPSAATPAVVANPVEAVEKAKGDDLLREATEAYQRNEFDEAQRQLDELEKRGLFEEDARRLQSNLDIVNADDDEDGVPDASGAGNVMPVPITGEKQTMARRVREQAKARAVQDIAQRRVFKERARRLRAQGDYKAAEAEYRKALKVNRKLKKLEQDESKAADYESEGIEADLAETKSEAAAAESMSKIVDPGWLSIGEPAEHGLGAEDVEVPDLARDDELPSVAPPPVSRDGPRVLMPVPIFAETILYSFDLWAPNARKTVVVHARRRLELPPDVNARRRRR